MTTSTTPPVNDSGDQPKTEEQLQEEARQLERDIDNFGERIGTTHPAFSAKTAVLARKLEVGAEELEAQVDEMDRDLTQEEAAAAAEAEEEE